MQPKRRNGLQNRLEVHLYMSVLDFLVHLASQHGVLGDMSCTRPHFPCFLSYAYTGMLPMRGMGKQVEDKLRISSPISQRRACILHCACIARRFTLVLTQAAAQRSSVRANASWKAATGRISSSHFCTREMLSKPAWSGSNTKKGTFTPSKSSEKSMSATMSRTVWNMSSRSDLFKLFVSLAHSNSTRAREGTGVRRAHWIKKAGAPYASRGAWAWGAWSAFGWIRLPLELRQGSLHKASSSLASQTTKNLPTPPSPGPHHTADAAAECYALYGEGLQIRDFLAYLRDRIRQRLVQPQGKIQATATSGKRPESTRWCF